METARQTIGSLPPSVPLRPEHVAALVANVLPGTHAAVIGIRTDAPWDRREGVVVGGRTHPVVWAPSALAAREALDHHVGSGPALVLLTPLAEDDLGWDVVLRLARCRLLELAPWDLVRDLFRARSIDPRLTSHPWMARLLLDAVPSTGYAPVPGGVLDAETAWRHVLEHTLGLPHARPDAEALLEASLDPAFAPRLAALPDAVAGAVSARIAETAGPLGSLLMAAVAAGQGARLFALGLACDVVFPADAERPADARAIAELEKISVRLEPYLGGEAVDRARGRQWAEATQRALDRLTADAVPVHFQQAEVLLGELRAEAFVGLSTVLPAAYQQRLAAFGEAVEATMAGTAPDRATHEALTRVLRHRQSAHDPERIERLQMASRLARYLEHQKTPPTPARSLGTAAAAYARGGAYADWARGLLLGGEPEGPLAAALAALSSRVQESREQENHAFAENLAAWNRSPGSEPGLLPVEEVLAGLVAPAATARPILLLVLDGMAYSTFYQLYDGIRQQGWQEWLLAEQRERPSALAVAPSITRLSRTSLLSGRVAAGAAADEKRAFAKHPTLAAASRSTAPPALFHKAELTEGGASGLAEPVRAALQDERRRVVGVVLNVLDDALAKSDQVRPRWTLADIPLLEALLFEARVAGRIVVLTSDHGHVLETEGIPLPGDEAERWRGYAEPVADEEIVLEGPRVEAAAGVGRVVVPWSERVRYVRKKTGYHGGASPQEMLVPVAVFAPADQPVDGGTPAAAAPPAWWSDKEAAPPPPPRQTAPVSSRRPARSVEPTLFGAPAALESSPQPDWIKGLFASEAYKAQRSSAGRLAPPDDSVRTILVALEKGQGRASRSVLAHALGIPEIRVRGLLAGLQRLLNLDGYPVITADESSGAVEWNRTLLRTQFQLEGLTR